MKFRIAFLLVVLVAVASFTAGYQVDKEVQREIIVMRDHLPRDVTFTMESTVHKYKNGYKADTGYTCDSVLVSWKESEEMRSIIELDKSVWTDLTPEKAGQKFRLVVTDNKTKVVWQ